jgi:hypothetical protein
LLPDPLCRVSIPLVNIARDGAKRIENAVPPPGIGERMVYGGSNEGTSAPGTDPGVEFSDKVIINTDVYPHGLNIAHSKTHSD